MLQAPSSTPLVSIILYVKNGARTIDRALSSALAQDYDAIEVIVIDGASTDGTLDVLERHRSSLTVFRSRTDRGAFEAANEGLRCAKGDVVCFLMADDWLEAHAARTAACTFAAKPEIKIVSSGARIVDEGPGEVFVTSYEKPGVKNALTLENILGMPMSAAYFWRRSALEELGGFSSSYQYAHDRDLLMRAWLSRYPASTVNDILYTYRKHRHSRTLGGDDGIAYAFLEEHCRMAGVWLGMSSLDPGTRQTIAAWRRDQRVDRILIAFRRGFGAFSGQMLIALGVAPGAFVMALRRLSIAAFRRICRLL